MARAIVWRCGLLITRRFSRCITLRSQPTKRLHAKLQWLGSLKVDHIIYQHIDDQHVDTLRFVKDCSEWFNEPIEVHQSPLKSVENACRFRSYINGIRGAACSRMLKRELRVQWEHDNSTLGRLRYVWGFDCTERGRIDRIIHTMPYVDHLFPLRDAGITKAEAHGYLKKVGIPRPTMYDLGYPNNNCIGCVKGGMGYWNKIRIDFPKVFAARSALERLIGGTCINGTYLDELDTSRGKDSPIIVPDCGAMCENV